MALPFFGIGMNPQPAPSRARTLEAGKRWARLAQARAASRPGLCATTPGRRAGVKKAERRRIDAFVLLVLEKTLESPLDCKEIKPVNSKGNQS